MLLPSLVASALLLGASAFLVVPDTAGDVPVGHDLVATQTARQLKVDVKCRECPFPLIVDDSKILWEDNFDSSLVGLPKCCCLAFCNETDSMFPRLSISRRAEATLP